MAIEARHERAETGAQTRVRRLNWGCGRDGRYGWINLDRTAGPGVDLVADIREGLPIESGTIDYVVGFHALQELAYTELAPALAELLRVLRPGGTLRLAVPDLDAGIRAYTEHEDDDFPLAPDEARSRGGRFIAHVLSRGRSRTLFTFDFAEELLLDAGFVDVTRCRSGETASRSRDIVELDEREGERESLFIEATRPPGRHPFVEVLEVAPVERDQERFAGFNLDAPQRGGLSHDGSLEIVGWVVGRESGASEVDVLVDGEVIGRAPVDLVRPGVGRDFAGSPGSRSAGFGLVLIADGVGISELVLKAALEDGTAIPLWTIRVEASREAPSRLAPASPSPRPEQAEGGSAAPAR
jgi:predicted SAM-dependent methyltransferase